jgi:apolipoprotein N-acyltransferase
VDTAIKHDRPIDPAPSLGSLPIDNPRWATWKLAACGAALLWLIQPPMRLWPLAWISLVPWILIASRPIIGRRDYLIFYLSAFAYWTVTMQGIRHAHPAMYVAWIALSAYLAVYPLAWLWLVRVAWGSQLVGRSVSGQRCQRLGIGLSVPIVWTAMELIRNYLLTGISAAMLGHSLIDVPILIQIADTFGSYGVSFLIALVNAAITLVVLDRKGARGDTEPKRTAGLAIVSVLATLIYGGWRLNQAELTQRASSTTIALLGRDEAIVYEQNEERERQIFDAYYLQAVEAARLAKQQNVVLGAVVWPESMFTGTLPWYVADRDKELATFPGQIVSEEELREIVAERQAIFQRRAEQIQASLRQITGQTSGPDLLGGCAVVRYDKPPGGHSGCVWIAGDGRVAQWYAKTHLVMFGEYIPLIQYLPFIKRWIPAGMGILPGQGPAALKVGDVVVSPNVCIETAVERVTINHIRELISQDKNPDVIVNVTNDGWFDRTSIVEHHLRCSQMVAVACRRPILIAANGGPTSWIDSSGRIVQRLPSDQSGMILANVSIDDRVSPVVRIGDWPARMLAFVCLVIAVVGWLRSRNASYRHGR